jgi:putative ABC transport system substrate-binding protein
MSKSGQNHIGVQRHNHDRRIGGRHMLTLIAAVAVSWPLFSHAQQSSPAVLKHIGWLSGRDCQWRADSPFDRRFRELGWIKGQNYDVECVATAGRLDQLPTLARELVSRRPDVIIAYPTSFIKALKQETTTIPIVMFATPDPIGLNVITNLARPEGNVTGTAWFGFDILPKRLELLKEMLPHLKRVAIIAAAQGDPKMFEAIEKNATIATRTLGVYWELFRPAVVNDLDDVFAHVAAEHFDAAYIQSTILSNENQKRFGQLALRHLIPTIGEGVEYARNGLLFTYSQDWGSTVSRAAEYVDKILRGAKPSELPVEQPTRLDLAINLKTAKALGLTVPGSLLARADEIIE